MVGDKNLSVIKMHGAKIKILLEVFVIVLSAVSQLFSPRDHL
jgi:hypothetical protein